MRSIFTVFSQILLVLLSWGASGFLLYSYQKFLLLPFVVLCLVALTYLIYRRVRTRSMLVAVAIMSLIEFFKLFNDYQKSIGYEFTLTQFRVIELVMPFSVIFTILILYIFKKSRRMKIRLEFESEHN